MSAELLRYLPVWFVAYLFSLTCHEAAHALVALLGGDRTAEEQATLDPMKHIAREPIGTVVLPLVSFFIYGGHFMLGAASVPVDPRWQQRFPRRAAMMAAAGPLANFALALIAGGVIFAALRSGTWLPAIETLELDRIVVGADGEPTAITTFVSVLFSVNLLLGTFNLIPMPPLDGHVIVPLFLSPHLQERWYGLFEGPGRFLGLAFAMIIHYELFGPLFLRALGLLYGF
jgi:Zn-dependent protease